MRTFFEPIRFLFDTYKPALEYNCPVCGSRLNKWQGKYGPCFFFVWSEGVAHPIDQNASPGNLSEEERKKIRLPKDFIIYSHDCSCTYRVEAICRCSNKVWIKTELVTFSNAKKKKGEKKEDFKKRLKWLQGKNT